MSQVWIKVNPSSCILNSDFEKTQQECFIYFKFKTCCVRFSFSFDIFCCFLKLALCYKEKTIDAYHLDSIKKIFMSKFEVTWMNCEKHDGTLPKVLKESCSL